MSEPVVPDIYGLSTSPPANIEIQTANSSSSQTTDSIPHKDDSLATTDSHIPQNTASEDNSTSDPQALPSEATPSHPTEAVNDSVHATTTNSSPTVVSIVHLNKNSEDIAAAILAATSSEIHEAQNLNSVNISSQSSINTPASDSDPALSHSETIPPPATAPIPIRGAAETQTELQAAVKALPFVYPSSYLRNPVPWNPTSPTPPPAVAATLGSIALTLPQHPTVADDPTLSLEIPPVTTQAFTEPITAYSETNFQPLTMSEPQTGELLSETDYHQLLGLRMIRRFLKVRTSYDVLPLSFRLIVLDNNLLIKKSLGILIQNAIVSAPLWNSQTSTFAGLLTATDYINVIQYYCLYPDELGALEQFKLRNLRDIEAAIGVSPIEDVSVHPTKPLYQALRQMLQTRARRIPLVDVDEETGRESVISVITQYRILKFIAVNNEFNTILLRKSLREIGIGSYENLITLNMDSTVLDAVGKMVLHNISSIPIVDKNNHVLNVFEAVDIIPCIQGGKYEELSSDIGEALCKRADESPGIYTCSEDDRLDAIFDTIRKSRVHRLVVVDDEARLRGIVSLSDILKYVLLHGEETDELYGEEEDEEEIKRQYAIYNQLNMQTTQK